LAEDDELILHPGGQHYFADSTLPSYDADDLDRLYKCLRYGRHRSRTQSCTSSESSRPTPRLDRDRSRAAACPIAVSSFPAGSGVAAIFNVRVSVVSGSILCTGLMSLAIPAFWRYDARTSSDSHAGGR